MEQPNVELDTRNFATQRAVMHCACHVPACVSSSSLNLKSEVLCQLPQVDQGQCHCWIVSLSYLLERRTNIEPPHSSVALDKKCPVNPLLAPRVNNTVMTYDKKAAVATTATLIVVTRPLLTIRAEHTGHKPQNPSRCVCDRLALSFE